MILAVTSGDAATSSNLSVCNKILAMGFVCLSGIGVHRVDLINLLTKNALLDFFFAGHGSEMACIGSDGHHAVGTSDAALLSSRRTFAMACHTAGKLGMEVSAAGGTWVGFVGPINCFPSDDDIIDLFQKVPAFVVEHLPSIKDGASSQAFVDQFCGLLESIIDDLDQRGIASLEPYAAVDIFKRRIRVWLPGASVPQSSGEATQPATRF